MAPLGLGVGDFVVVGKAAHTLYQRFRNCKGECQTLRRELQQLDDVLNNFRDLFTRVNLSGPQFAQMVEREKDSQALLDDVNAVLTKNGVVDGPKVTITQRLRWNKGTVDDLRARLTAHVAMLNASYASISQSAVLDALERLTLNIQTGKTKLPSTEALSQASVHEEAGISEEWSGLIQDLQNLGITPHMVQTHRDTILRYLENAVSAGELGFARDHQSVYSGSASSYREAVGNVVAWLNSADAQSISRDSIDATVTAAIRYFCIMCGEAKKSKNECHRHLIDVHINPKVFTCEACGARFDHKIEARNHSAECGKGVFLYTSHRVKKTFTSDFTGETFRNDRKYAEHLLPFCVKQDTGV